jgi:acetyl esterase/lipase
MSPNRHFYLLLLFSGMLLLNACKKQDPGNNNPVVEAAVFPNVSYGTQALQNMDVYLPAGRNSSTTKSMIMIHGGAWTTGDKSNFLPFIDSLQRRLPGYAIFNINYRLSVYPSNLFPTQELDTKAAIEYIYSKRNEYGISDNFVLLGASAGGHLALLHAYKYSSPVKIKSVVDFFGPTDLTEMYNNPGQVPASSLALIIGTTPAQNPTLYQQSSPINYVSASASCPTIILQGGLDPLVNPVTQSLRLKNALQAAGVPNQYVFYPDKGHGVDWDNATYFDAFNKIQSFLSTHNP